MRELIFCILFYLLVTATSALEMKTTPQRGKYLSTFKSITYRQSKIGIAKQATIGKCFALASKIDNEGLCSGVYGIQILFYTGIVNT